MTKDSAVSDEARREKLVALRERVRGLTGADREVDALIHIALVPDYGAHMELSPARYIRFEDVWRKNLAEGLYHANNVADWWKCPSYTGPGADAALALVERVLPGCVRRSGQDNSGNWFAYIATASGPEFTEHAASEPLAILLALLSALIEAHHG